MKIRYYSQEPDFRVGNIDIQSVSRPKGYRHSFSDGREKHGFIYMVNGGISDIFQNEDISELTALKGDLIFIPRGCAYTGVYTEDNTKVRIVQFDLIHGELPDYLSAPVKIDLPRAYELTERFFNTDEKHPFYCLSRLYELLWKIDELHSSLPQKFQKLRNALSEIHENWHENRKVAYYARLCDMSEVSFRRLFSEYTGLSPINYRNGIRLEHAKNKLQSGEYNVCEAAYETGFSNVSFFIRLYKKKYGHTPKKG